MKTGYCSPYCFLEIIVGGQNQQGGHKPGKHWEFEKLSESQGQLRENSEKSQFLKKTWKLRENVRCGINANKNLSQQIFSLELLRKKLENTLEISEKTEGILSKCGSLSKYGHPESRWGPCQSPLLEKTLSP